VGTLEAGVAVSGLSSAWAAAVTAAEAGAESTAAMSPKVGRARPLAARSVGTSDPGAVSFGICVRAALEGVR